MQAIAAKTHQVKKESIPLSLSPSEAASSASLEEFTQKVLPIFKELDQTDQSHVKNIRQQQENLEAMLADRLFLPKLSP